MVETLRLVWLDWTRCAGQLTLLQLSVMCDQPPLHGQCIEQCIHFSWRFGLSCNITVKKCLFSTEMNYPYRFLFSRVLFHPIGHLG